jgi:hypothetical protein
MKIYIANSGSYDDFNVHAAFYDPRLANDAGENDPIELEVLDGLPARIPVRTMHWSARLMHQVGVGHFHTPNPDPIDCPFTNVLTVPDESDDTVLLWPWDIESDADIPSCSVSSGGGLNGRWVEVKGVDQARVEIEFERHVLEAKSLLIRKTER